jgi:hypothetical protein
MRTPIRALLAATVSLAALSIAVAAASAAPPPSGTSEVAPAPAPGPAPGGVGATCVTQHPDCNDRLIGAGGSEPSSPGSSGDGAPPPTGVPSPGCGQDVVSGTGPDAVVSNAPCQPGGPLPEPRPQVVVPRPGMSGVTPIAFVSATVRPDDRTVDVRFWSGIEPCSVLDHVDVVYGSDTVTITLFQGSDPSAGMVACPDIAVLKQVTVTLDQELAGRRIVDGAK